MKVAVVGCGTIVAMHLDALEQIEAVEIVAFCDIIENRATKCAQAYGGAIYTDFDTMLKKEAIDAVHICTPHHVHMDMIQKAVDRGIAVFTEKPPVISWEEWHRFYSLRDKGFVGVSFQNRYNPDSVLFEKYVNSEETGKILGGRGIVTWDRDEAYYNSAEWRGKLETEGGGVLINQAIHTLDLLIRCIGRPDSIEAHLATYRLKRVISVEDTLDAYFSYNDGKRGIFYATNAHCSTSPVLVEVSCENATIRLEAGMTTIWWSNGTVETVRPEPLPISGKGKLYWGAAHTACITDFYKALAEGKPFANNIESTKSTMETTLGMYQSAREQTIVSF